MGSQDEKRALGPRASCAMARRRAALLMRPSLR
jgi:hypothetical protein